MTGNTTKKHGKLLWSLVKQTEAGAIEWAELFGERVSAPVGRFRITLEPTRGRGGSAAERIKIEDEDGEVVDQFIDEDLTVEALPTFSAEGVYPLMVQLRKDALRIANGSDAALDELLENLKPPSAS